MYTFRPAHVLQLVVGMIILVATFVLLSAVVVGTFLLGLVAFLFMLVPGFFHLSGWLFKSATTTLPPALNVIWLLVILGLVLYGLFRSKPGYVAAPLVFCALWFGASLVDRKRLEAEIAPQIWAAPVTPEARSQRTLIINAKDFIVSRRLTDRHIDRLITIDRDNKTAAVTHIREVSKSRCVVGRQGEPEPHSFACSTSRDIGDIPDGLVVERIDHFPPAQADPEQDKHAELDEPIARIERAAERAKERVAANPRNCNETQAKLRERGQERVLFSWSQCQPFVRAYIPSFGSSGSFGRYDRPRPPSVWGFALGPSHRVVFGPADIAPEAMINAIYGLDDSTQPGSRAASP